MKTYFAIITEETSDYPDEKSLGYFGEHPWEGNYVTTLYGDDFEELYGEGSEEGLFYQLYYLPTGTRVSYGIWDPDGPAEELDAFQAEAQGENRK